MRDDGKPFERLTHEIFSMLIENPAYMSVEHDVQLGGQDGPRQIDVLIRARVASLDLLTIIECRDHARRLDVTAIDGLHSKMQDVRASKAVLVARTGFSAAAQRKARRLGITLCIASSARASLWNVGTQIPVILTELKCTELRPEFNIYLHSGVDHLPDDCGFTINDLSLEDTLCEAIRSGEIECSLADSSFDWTPVAMADPFIRDKESVRMPITNLVVHVSVKARHFFGYVQDLPNTKSLLNLSENRQHIFVVKDDFFDYESYLCPYRSLDMIPKIKATTAIVGVAIHPIRIAHATFKLTHTETGKSFSIKVCGSKFAK